MTPEERNEAVALVKTLLLSNARMVLYMRQAIVEGVSPNKVLQDIKQRNYDSIAAQNAEEVLKLIVEDLKQ